MRFRSNGNWSVGPVGAQILGMLCLLVFPVFATRGAYRIDVRPGHAALGVFTVLLIATLIVGGH